MHWPQAFKYVDIDPWEANLFFHKETKSFWYPSKARAGWPSRLGLVRATLWAEFVVIYAQL